MYSIGERSYVCKDWEYLSSSLSVLSKATVIKITNSVKILAVIGAYLSIVI